MYPVISIRGTHILLPQLIVQMMLFIHGAFHLKVLCGNMEYLFIYAFSSQLFLVSSMVIFNGLRSNHQKLLKMSLDISIWLIIYKYNIRMQHLMAHFPLILQWLSDSTVSAKITKEGLIWSYSYSIKAFAASKLMTLILDGNNTRPKMAKATNLYCLSPNLPSSTFFFIRASMTFHLKPPLATYICWSFPDLINWLPLKICFKFLIQGRSCGCYSGNLGSFYTPQR